MMGEYSISVILNVKETGKWEDKENLLDGRKNSESKEKNRNKFLVIIL